MKTGSVPGAICVLRLEGIPLRVFLGSSPRERLFPRTVDVDVSYLLESGQDVPATPLDYDLICSALDGLSGSGYDYVEQLCADIMHLLERLAAQGRWRVTVRKESPPTKPGIQRASFEMER
ncbi:dihydroneopterin aldolase [Candidatus Fermentibacterales bacterium]|nr:dihydroneopterin aldolase [Candidatus Fermentibacterales bacterium]